MGAARYLEIVGGQARDPGAVLARIGLRAVSVPYGLAMRARNRFFDLGWKRRERAGVPVVSVGNLTLGGTGKTPCVEYLARRFRERSVVVAILSRGYGGRGGVNDEALVLEENLPDVPHLQGPDRAALARIARDELEAELLILDDGFQHRRLERDCDVVLLDATNPWGHGYLFPRGLMREPASALRRADTIVLTRCDQVGAEERRRLIDAVRRIQPEGPLVESTHAPAGWIQQGRPERPPEALRGRCVGAFCGLGNPRAFHASLQALGVEVRAFKTFRDHHAYTRADVEELRDWARRLPGDAILATSQKDLVKLRIDRLGERDLWALRIGLRIEPGPDRERFHQRLDALVG